MNNKEEKPFFVNVYTGSYGQVPKVSNLFDITVESKRIIKSKNGAIIGSMVKVYLRAKNFVLRDILINKDYSKLCAGVSFTGKAFLKGDDVFDDVKGFDIAEHRARCKVNRYIWNLLEHKYAKLEQEIMSISCLQGKFLEREWFQMDKAEELGGYSTK